jgi:hypothetical protein
VAEWSCSGLQSRVQRFDSAPSLQPSNPFHPRHKRIHPRNKRNGHENILRAAKHFNVAYVQHMAIHVEPCYFGAIQGLWRLRRGRATQFLLNFHTELLRGRDYVIHTSRKEFAA